MDKQRRNSRLGGQILRDISTLMDGELNEKSPALVTFTQVRLSKDLRHAVVYYSVLGDETARTSIAIYLERERGRIRHLVGKNLRIRHIPEFTFKFDPSVEEGLRIEQLLNEIHNESQ